MFSLTGAGFLHLGDLSGVCYHLALLPLVAMLPGTTEGRAAGYVWIILDTALNVAAINGLDADSIWALRLGSHIGAGIWIISSSLGMRRVPLATGLLLGGSLIGHALVGPLVPDAVLAATAFPLMIAWLGQIAAGKAIQSMAPQTTIAPAVATPKSR